MSRPSDGAILERSKSLCNQACWTISLQRRRLDSVEPEDEDFLFRPWADFQFLIVALRRLRRAAELGRQVALVRRHVTAAIRDFDRALPYLAKMRNVGEHVDDYASDRPNRKHADVDRKQLQVGARHGALFEWLGHTVDIFAAEDAAGRLFGAVRTALAVYAEQTNVPNQKV